jgi:hypothetical protein
MFKRRQLMRDLLLRNAPMDHITARKLLEAGISPAPELACDPAVPLKTHLPAG